MYADKVQSCRHCGVEFTFSAGEQEFYAGHGLANEPRRCKACRATRKKESYEVVCDNCGTATMVPFRPRGDNPVYCRECFAAMRKG